MASNEADSRISTVEVRSVTKSWNTYKRCDKDAGGVNFSQWLEHVLHCEPLAQALRDENAFTPMCQIHFKVELSRTMVKELGLLHLIRADTASAYQRIRLFVWANSVKSPILIRTRKFLIHVTFQPSIYTFALFDATAARRRARMG